MPMKNNYHTHTPRCKHASGTEFEYCEKAVENHYSILGFTDHCAWPYREGFVSTFHMDISQIDDYVSSVMAARQQYEGRLEVHLGWECEYYPEYMNWLRETKEKYGFEYFILGNHFDTTDDGGMYFGSCTTPEQFKKYVKMCTAGLETGLYKYFAHPDLFLRSCTTYDKPLRDASRELCRACKALGIPTEYNLLGYIIYKKESGEHLGYPCRAFWETAAEEGVDCIIGTDAHSPDRFDDQKSWDEAVVFLNSLGMNRLTRLDL